MTAPQWWCSSCHQFFVDAGFCPYDGQRLQPPPDAIVTQPAPVHAVSAHDDDLASALASMMPADHKAVYERLVGQTLDRPPGLDANGGGAFTPGPNGPTAHETYFASLGEKDPDGTASVSWYSGGQVHGGNVDAGGLIRTSSFVVKDDGTSVGVMTVERLGSGTLSTRFVTIGSQ